MGLLFYALLEGQYFCIGYISPTAGWNLCLPRVRLYDFHSLNNFIFSLIGYGTSKNFFHFPACACLAWSFPVFLSCENVLLLERYRTSFFSLLFSFLFLLPLFIYFITILLFSTAVFLFLLFIFFLVSFFFFFQFLYFFHLETIFILFFNVSRVV